MTIFIEIGLIIIIAAIAGLIARKLHQSEILGYLIAGLIIGPVGLKIVHNEEVIKSLASIGATFLLFLVGLQLNWKKAKDIGWLVFIISVSQLIITWILGYYLARLFNFNLIESLYISLALTFSSTIIVVKILSEQMRLDHLFGRISLGILIIQDLLAILALIFLKGAGQITQYSLMTNIAGTVSKGLLLLVVSILIGRYIIGYLLKQAAKYHDLLFVLAIGWCFCVAILSYFLGFSIEIGAFLAGLSLAASGYVLDVVAKVRPLRDFFIVLFFVLLGLEVIQLSWKNIQIALIFSIFVLLIHFFVILLTMHALGFKKKNSFLTAITLSQISEFSLIIISLGYAQGYLNENIITIITLTAIITIGVSSWFITHSYMIYNKLSRFLNIFERKNTLHSVKIEGNAYNDHVIVLGARRTGKNILKTLKKLHEQILVVDFNPEVADELADTGIDVIYGDASEEEVLKNLHLEKAKMIISTIPNFSDNMVIVKQAREKNKKMMIFIVAFDADEALALYEAGASYVIMPQHISGDHIAFLIDEIGLDEKKILQKKMTHLKILQEK